MAEEIEKRMKIVVPTDFSHRARAALERALEFAPRLGGEVVLLHLVEVSATAAEASLGADVEALAGRLRKEARARLAALAESADPERRSIVRADVIDGAPVHGIIDFARAEGADLIAIGSHGRTGVARFLLGSVAERVVRLAGCDVLVVRGGAKGS